MSKPHVVCPYCHGVVTGTRRVPLEYAVQVHEQSCPAKGRKPQ